MRSIVEGMGGMGQLHAIDLPSDRSVVHGSDWTPLEAVSSLQAMGC